MVSDTMKPLVLFHGNCNDGFGAAWVAHKRFGDEADYLPVSYGEPPPGVAENRDRPLYVIDFSYPRDVMFRLAALRHERMVVLDHHKTAQDGLRDIEVDLVSHNCGTALTVRFDMSKSGARLAWEHFFPGEQAPPLVAYVEDRDLWRFSLPFSKAVNAAISSHPHDFSTWDGIDDALQGDVDACSSMVVQGEAIERYKSHQVDAICRNARDLRFDGVDILAANTSVLFSEVAGKLAEGRPFGAAWFVRADGKTQWSLRSTDAGMDVSKVARRRGGGGHRNAAGFEEPTT